MDNQNLIMRIQQRAHDPKQATDAVGPCSGVANPPITLKQLIEAEAELGLPLPEFLRQLYLQVGNGGFGPANGLIALRGGSTIDGLDLVDLYVKLAVKGPPPPYYPWPKHFLIIADWGCIIWTLLNWQNGAVYRFNGDRYNADEQPWESVIVPEAPSLEAWFENWLSGT